MRGAITPAHDAVSTPRRIPGTQAPGARAGTNANVIVRPPLMIRRAITPADQDTGDHICMCAGAIVRRA
jgi:hypothetical protein